MANTKISASLLEAAQTSITSLGTLSALGVTGNITVGGTVDGIDIAARDGVLTSTTTTAGAALPKAGGTMTGTITVAGSSSGTVDALIITNTDTTNNGLSIGVDSSENAFFWNGSNTLMNFATNNTARMRIDASGDLIKVGGVIKGERGTASAPAYSFSDDVDTGMFNISNADLGFSVGGTERMRIDASGNVGIGNSNPSAFNSLGATDKLVIGDSTVSNLTLFGTTYGSLAFADSDTSGSTAQYAGLIQYYHADNSMQFYTNAIERMRIDAAGTLLINSTTTADTGGNKLYINSGVNAAPVTSGTTQTGGALRLRGANNAVLDMGLNSVYTWIQATDKANLANGYPLTLNPNGGNVGIGNMLAGAALHVDTAANVTTGFGAPLIKVGGDNSWAGNGSLYSIGFGYVDNSISNKSPAEIGFATTSTAGYTLGNLVFATRGATTNTAPTERMRIGSDGTTGFFGAAANTRADITLTTGTSDSNKRWGFGGGATGNNAVFYIINESNVGVYVSHGGQAWTAHSDERIKENIVSVGTVLPTLMNMRCVKYNLKSNPADTKIGFIAQDWESNFPEIVDENEHLVLEDDGTIGTHDDSDSTTPVKAMAYTETIPLLLKAIQEQQATIEALTQRLTVLENN